MTDFTPTRYVYPPSFRTRMSNLWSADVNNWWLDDDELLLPILRQIREFINDRTLNPETTQSISLREMRAIFEAMTVEEGDTRAGGSAGSVGPGVEGEFDFGMGGMEGSSDRIEAGSWGMGSSPDVDWGLVTSGEVGQGEWGSVIGGPSPERGA